MRRGEDDLAISPPPEFQDNGPSAGSSSLVVLLPPPPKDFRDLTPSPAGYTDPVLTFGRTPHTLPPLQSFHHGRTFVRKSIWDFADRVSFSIIHEAVVIATVLPEAGSTIVDFRFGPTKGGSFIADSFEQNALSSSTSWEYLPPPSRFPPIRKHVKSKHHSELPSAHMKNITPLKYSPSRHSEDVEDIHFVIVKHELPSSSKAKETLDSYYSDGDGCGKESCIIDKIHHLPMKNNSRYNFPMQCDIYSIPVDSISQPGQSSASANTQITNYRNWTRCHYGKDSPKRHSIQVVEKRPEPDELTSSGSSKMRSNIRRRSSADEDERNPENEFKIREKNNNNENARFDIGQSNSSLVAVVSDITRRKINESSLLKNYGESSPSPGRNGDGPSNGTNNEKEGWVKEKKKIGVTFLNLFRRNRHRHHIDEQNESKVLQSSNQNEIKPSNRSSIPVECHLINARALPSPPISESSNPVGFQRVQRIEMTLSPEGAVVPGDFANSLEKVKDCGWYWGPLPSEGAEDLLRGEPDGSFIVRDSSDARYIFSLTFKLNGLIRHVRIEHDQGNFSFGPLTRFKASTIVDFVEKAVAHSRSGRFLFFLHRRPVLGPMRVQLLHPYSRFRHPRSLQHMCRFVILKFVRRDLVESLGLPKLLLDYLNSPQYYFESPDKKAT